MRDRARGAICACNGGIAVPLVLGSASTHLLTGWADSKGAR
jgi:allophanate hydrolase subunit 2